MPSARAHRQKKKARTWTLPTVLGLILTGLGPLEVIELRPQLNTTPGDLLATNQPFTAPFEVTNTGYLSLHVEHVTVILHKVEFGPRFTFNDSHQNEMDWDDFDLERGGSKTIVTRFSDGMPTTADIVIVVDYKYFGVKGRWPFRFVGVHMDNWRWSKQPIGDVASMLDRIVEESLKKHEELRQLRERYK